MNNTNRNDKCDSIDYTTFTLSFLKDSIFKEMEDIIYVLANLSDQERIKLLITKYQCCEKEAAEKNKEVKDYLNRGLINICGIQINYFDSCWDFTHLALRNKNIFFYKYTYYQDLPPEYETSLRINNLINIFNEGIHASNNANKHSCMKNLLRFVFKNYNCTTIQEINVSMVNEYIIKCKRSKKESCNSIKSIASQKEMIKCFLTNISLIKNYNVSNDLIIYLNDIDRNEIKHHIELNKTKLLDTTFYKELSNILTSEYMNEDLPKDSRQKTIHLAKGLLALEMQCGYRSQESNLLQKNCIEKIEVDGLVGYCMKFNTTKGCRGDEKVFKTGEIPLNKTSLNILEKLINESNIDNPDSNFVVTKIPRNKMLKVLKQTCIEHYRTLNNVNRIDSDCFPINEKVSTIRESKAYSYIDLEKIKDLNDEDIISMTTTKEFRTYYSTFLDEMGASYSQISKILQHGMNMEHYYVRKPHPVQKDIDYSTNLFKEIIDDNLNIIGPKGKAYNSKINEYKSKFNIENSLDDIVNKLCMQMPVRSIHGGFCIKSNPNRLCSVDADVDSDYCAYHMCPNQSSLYFYFPISYRKCKDYAQLIEHNAKLGYHRYSEKEAFYLRNELNNQLIPLLNETKKEIVKQGIERIVQKHPELNNYIYDLEKIDKEIEIWKNMIEQKIN